MSITGDRLRELRKEKGLSIVELSKATGLTRQAISNYETGIRMPRPEPLEILTDFFNVDTDYVLGRSDTKNVLNFNGIYESGWNDAMKTFQTSFKNIPVYSGISCGPGVWIDEVPESYIGIPDVMTTGGGR